MRIIDISQPILGCRIYPGDPIPRVNRICSTENGDLYNLTEFFMCAHNGTHIDAPFHFLPRGDTVDAVPLHKTVGYAFVANFEGSVNAEDAAGIIRLAESACPDGAKRILIKGNAVVTQQAAEVFAKKGLLLLGNESQTVGPEDSPMAVHKILLETGTVLLEGIVLDEAKAGSYLLCAAPLNLNGADGAPCRAVLIEL